MKRLLLLLLLLCGALAAQQAKTYPDPAGYVDDYAHVLSDGGRAEIEAICGKIHSDTRAQVFLVTVPSLGGDSIEQFSNDLFHQWKIGEKGTDRGVLVVFATGERQHRIEVGYGFEGTLNDARAGDIGRDITPALHLRHYDQAGLTAVNELAAVIKPDAPAAPGEAPPAQAEHVSLLAKILIFSMLALFVVIVWAAIRAARRSRQGSSGHLYDSEVAGYPASSGTLFADTGSTSSSSFDSSSSFADTSSSSDSDSSFSGGDGGDSGGGGASGSDGDSGGDSGGGDGGGGDGGGGGSD